MLIKPVPKQLGNVSLIMTRHKSGIGNMQTKFRLYNNNNSGILLNSKKKIACKTSYHLVLSAFEQFDKKKESFVGKIRADSSKHSYHIYDNGSSKHSTSLKNTQSRKELCAIAHRKNASQNSFVKSFDCILPQIDEEGVQMCPEAKGEFSELADGYETSTNHIVMQTVEPKWNDKLQQYVLNFGSDADTKSVKNFKLELKSGIEVGSGESHEFLEFCKHEEDKFELTFRWPFSVMAAFSAAVSAIEAPVLNK